MKKLHLVEVVEHVIYRRAIEAHTKAHAQRQAVTLWEKDRDGFKNWLSSRDDLKVVACMAQMGEGREKLADILQRGDPES